jgi:hypothetical protein
MRSSQAIAVWLFERLDLDIALAGDLLEERARRGSAFWYWRQVLIALWIGIWRAIRDHRVLALRAVATGFAIELLCFFFWGYLGSLLPGRLVLSLQSWTINWLLTLLNSVATGWVVARTHRAQPVPMVLLFLIFDLLGYVYVSFFLWGMSLTDLIAQPWFRAYLALFIVNIFARIVGVPLGGISARAKKALSAADPRTA